MSSAVGGLCGADGVSAAFVAGGFAGVDAGGGASGAAGGVAGVCALTGAPSIIAAHTSNRPAKRVMHTNV